MDSSVLDDFRTEILKNGYDINDFKLNNSDLTSWQSYQLSQINELATVKRKSTQKEKSYNAGNATSWVADFSKDLKLGFFN